MIIFKTLMSTISRKALLGSNYRSIQNWGNWQYFAVKTNGKWSSHALPRSCPKKLFSYQSGCECVCYFFRDLKPSKWIADFHWHFTGTLDHLHIFSLFIINIINHFSALYTKAFLRTYIKGLPGSIVGPANPQWGSHSLDHLKGWVIFCFNKIERAIHLKISNINSSHQPFGMNQVVSSSINFMVLKCQKTITVSSISLVLN